jgi:hypothetical protein
MKPRVLLATLLLLALFTATAAAFSFSFVFSSPGLVIVVTSIPPPPPPTVTVVNSSSSVVIINNNTGSVTVIPTNAPTIIGQPVSLTSTAGKNVVFVASAKGGSLAYHWQKNGVDLANSSRISGAASTTLHISKLKPADAGQYHLVASNTKGHAASHVATLTVH